MSRTPSSRYELVAGSEWYRSNNGHPQGTYYLLPLSAMHRLSHAGTCSLVFTYCTSWCQWVNDFEPVPGGKWYRSNNRQAQRARATFCHSVPGTTCHLLAHWCLHVVPAVMPMSKHLWALSEWYTGLPTRKKKIGCNFYVEWDYCGGECKVTPF